MEREREVELLFHVQLLVHHKFLGMALIHLLD